MREISLLIGGKAGDGINQSGLLLARLLAQLGYFTYMYFDYPSLIRGGHNFSVVRASERKIGSHRDRLDFILALNQDTVNNHSGRLKQKSRIIYDSGAVKSEGLGLDLAQIVREEGAQPIMRNSCLLGAFAKNAGIGWETVERVVRKNIPREAELNLKLARRGYQAAKEIEKLEPLGKQALPIFTGNEAIGLGLVNAGLKTYIAYPMTPSSSLLHFLAGAAKDFDLKVIHPESEIGVILMALGFSYAGDKVAVGTSGGGFCLMTEGLSLAGMAELPLVIVVCQRPGPSTGVPTYTAQSDLHFILNAGHGEFCRFVVAPGTVEQAFYWSGVALNISWKYQLPSIILSDKSLSEGGFSFEAKGLTEISGESPLAWDRKQPYKRYLDTGNGVSPLAFVPDKQAVIKVNSYEHDEAGYTAEVPGEIKKMCGKRLRKSGYLAKELNNYEAVSVYGAPDASAAVLCWGSNAGVCREAAARLGVKVIQPVVLSPFPVEQFNRARQGVKKMIAVENNATAQLTRLINCYGYNTVDKILKYDGRPFSADELETELNRTGL